MSVATLEETVIGADGGGDLASLVVAYHRANHPGELQDCPHKMCGVADQCVTLDAMFYGSGV